MRTNSSKKSSQLLKIEESESSDESDLVYIPHPPAEEIPITCSSTSSSVSTSPSFFYTRPRSPEMTPTSPSSKEPPEPPPQATMRTRNVKGRKLLRILKNLGYTMNRQKESHMTLKWGSKSVTVPNHSTIKRGTLGSILKQMG